MDSDITLAISESEIEKTIVSLQGQLNSIFQTDDLIRDFTLLSGFLTFVHSKLQRLIENSLENELKKQLKVDSEPDAASRLQIDIKTIPYILDLSWERLWYPIFKWFLAYRKRLLSTFASLKKEQRPNFYVIFRKFNSKVGKFASSLTRFYLDLVQLVQTRVNTSVVIPSEIISKRLGLRQDSKSVSKVSMLPMLSPNAPLTPLVLLIHHRCLFYLGVLNRYKSMAKKINNNYVIDDFKIAREYLDTAILLCPAIGETFSQMGLIYFQTEDLGLGIYELVRGSLSSLPSMSALNNFKSFFLEKDSKIREKAIKTVIQIHSDSLTETRIVNREIIEYYFLVLFGYNFEKSIWRDPENKDRVLGGIGVKHMEQVFYERVASRFIKNIVILFKNLVVAIGGFSLLPRSEVERSSIVGSPTRKLSPHERSYLRFVFKYISRVFQDAVLKIWKDDFETFYYLGMVCTVLAWLLSNKLVMNYALSDELFLKSFSMLWNDIQKNFGPIFEKDEYKNICRREYYFEEDILLANFTCISFSESLFDNSKIFGSEDMVNRMEGFTPKSKKLTKRDEANIKLYVILTRGKDILLKNKCDIVLNPENGLFEVLPRKESLDVNKRDPSKGSGTTSRKISRKKKGTDRPNKSIESLESDIMRKRFAVTPAFSGPSIPAAPETLKTKPSLKITSKIEHNQWKHLPETTGEPNSLLKSGPIETSERDSIVGRSSNMSSSSSSFSSSSESSPEIVVTMDSIENTMKELNSQMKMLMFSNSEQINSGSQQPRSTSPGPHLASSSNSIPRSVSGDFAVPFTSSMYPYGVGAQNAVAKGQFYPTTQLYGQPVGMPPNVAPTALSPVMPWQSQQQLPLPSQDMAQVHPQQYPVSQYSQPVLSPMGQLVAPGYAPYMHQPPPGIFNNIPPQQPQQPQNFQQFQQFPQQYQQRQQFQGVP